MRKCSEKMKRGINSMAAPATRRAASSSAAQHIINSVIDHRVVETYNRRICLRRRGSHCRRLSSAPAGSSCHRLASNRSAESARHADAVSSSLGNKCRVPEPRVNIGDACVYWHRGREWARRAGPERYREARRLVVIRGRLGTFEAAGQIAESNRIDERRERRRLAERHGQS